MKHNILLQILVGVPMMISGATLLWILFTWIDDDKYSIKSRIALGLVSAVLMNFGLWYTIIGSFNPANQ